MREKHLRRGRSQYDLDALAANDVEQHKRCTGRTLCPPLQLRHIAGRQIEKMGKYRLTHACSLTQSANILARKRLRRSPHIFKVTHGDLLVCGGAENSAVPHVLSGFEQSLVSLLGF